MNSAGILPVIKENGKIYMLLGKDLGGWSGFSGGQDGDETPQETAFREFHEETIGIFPDVDISFLQRNCFHVHNAKTPTGKIFVMYLVDFSSLDTKNTTYDFHTAFEKTVRVCEREKTSVQWVEISNVFKRKLRFAFYKDIDAFIKVIMDWQTQSVIGDIKLK